MLYGELRGGIPRHTACAVIPQAASSERSEYGAWMLTGGDSPPVPTDVGKSYCSATIIAQKMPERKKNHAFGSKPISRAAL